MDTKLIHEVSKVDAQINKSNPPQLDVTASGNASSGSQSNPRLERRNYVVFPPDGIQEYYFQIDGADGNTTDDMKSHKVEDNWEDFPKELKGVRILGKTNQMEKTVAHNLLSGGGGEAPRG